jgi:hypothetical protein
MTCSPEEKTVHDVIQAATYGAANGVPCLRCQKKAAGLFDDKPLCVRCLVRECEALADQWRPCDGCGELTQRNRHGDRLCVECNKILAVWSQRVA